MKGYRLGEFMGRRYFQHTVGFTLVELMIVVAIIAFLSMVCVPSFTRFLAKAKRTEAYMNLGSIYAAQKVFWAENGRYAGSLQELGWKPEGYHGGGQDERFFYTYGFAGGSEGAHHCTGKLGAGTEHLAPAHASANEFLVCAAGDIDGDGTADVMSVNQFNEIKIVHDDLV